VSLEVSIPPLGESVSEGTIARWLKRDGDTVKADEPLFELETDKATMEIPAPAAGRLEIVELEGATVRVGTVVARIAEAAPAALVSSTAAGSIATAPVSADRPRAGGADTGARPLQPAVATAAERPTAPLTADEGARGLSPAVRRLVTEHSLDPAAIAGTGKDGRLIKEDVLRHVTERAPAAAPATASPTPAASGPLATSGERAAGRPSVERVERVPMSRLRRRIAERLVEAQRTAAILTTFNEVDCSAFMDVRRRHRERFKSTHGVDLGFMALFARAAVLALADVPVVNARIDGGDIVYHHHVHLGIAVSTERGLVVPVIRHADAMRLAELERAVNELATRARGARLVPDDLAGGTFSITNGGVFGSLLSTPILNPPQSGILGMHKIQERPVAVDGQVVVRPMMYVALSYDHRLVDGQQAVTFLVRVKERIEDPLRMLLEV
jgi:2-oxoglutarate dehydrogenase E2 component (dihydrolipoamide succinyltransferase)